MRIERIDLIYEKQVSSLKDTKYQICYYHKELF